MRLNIRTLNDDSDTAVTRKTALVGLELKRYRIDIAGLSEIRLPDSDSLHEPTSGYTYFWSGLSAEERRQHGVAIAMKDHIAARLESSPRAINERLITARIIHNITYIHYFT